LPDKGPMQPADCERCCDWSADASVCGFRAKINFAATLPELDGLLGHALKVEIPPTPLSNGIIGLARNSPQNPDVKELRGQNP
jgi:hypothetical protein